MIFVIGVICFFLGFLLASFLISWYHKERDSHVIRLQSTLDNMIDKHRQQKSLDSLKEEFDDYE